ncbi:hypothetical protein HTG_10320 [Natrinema mahii]|nr:hypothetical protein HTG_10320 [Natrinema mahii]
MTIHFRRAVIAVSLVVVSAIANYIEFHGTSRNVSSIGDLVIWLVVGIPVAYLFLTISIVCSTVVMERLFSVLR